VLGSEQSSAPQYDPITFSGFDLQAIIGETDPWAAGGLDPDRYGISPYPVASDLTPLELKRAEIQFNTSEELVRRDWFPTAFGASVKTEWKQGGNVSVQPPGWGGDYYVGTLKWRNEAWHVQTPSGNIVSHKDLRRWTNDRVDHRPSGFRKWAKEWDVRMPVYDITAALQTTAKKFFKEWDDLSDKDRLKLTLAKNTAWDITELGKGDNPGQLHLRKVIVNGKLYKGAEVNYILLGWLAARDTGNTYHTSGMLMAVHKGTKGFASFGAALQWYQAGFKGWGRWETATEEAEKYLRSTDLSVPEDIRPWPESFTWNIGVTHTGGYKD